MLNINAILVFQSMLGASTLFHLLYKSSEKLSGGRGENHNITLPALGRQWDRAILVLPDKLSVKFWAVSQTTSEVARRAVVLGKGVRYPTAHICFEKGFGSGPGKYQMTHLTFVMVVMACCKYYLPWVFLSRTARVVIEEEGIKDCSVAAFCAKVNNIVKFLLYHLVSLNCR